jgi:hypothetical protein
MFCEKFLIDFSLFVYIAQKWGVWQLILDGIRQVLYKEAMEIFSDGTEMERNRNIFGTKLE